MEKDKLLEGLVSLTLRSRDIYFEMKRKGDDYGAIFAAFGTLWGGLTWHLYQAELEGLLPAGTVDDGLSFWVD